MILRPPLSRTEPQPVDTLVDSPQSTLSGVARVLVHAGRLGVKNAEELVKSAKERRVSFVSAVISAGSVSASDLALSLIHI